MRYLLLIQNNPATAGAAGPDARRAEEMSRGSRFLAIHGPDWEMGMEIRQLDDPV